MTPARSQIENRKSKIVVVGAGPAGSSLAIRLATRGFAVTLIEKDRFPREKLCGEFISPECFRHFADLGVRSELFSKGGDRVFETRFYGKIGRSVAVPTAWFGSGEFALSLSRAEMDLALMDRARSVGVDVIENARVVSMGVGGGKMVSVTVNKAGTERFDVFADLFVDATGRSAILSKMADRSSDKPVRSGLVGFKAHLQDVQAEPGVCEIYFFDGGYGGLSQVEGGKANFCFLVKANIAKQFIGKTDDLFRSILDQNKRANERMQHASALHDWLGVTVGGFGLTSAPSPDNLVSAGDAGAFIDPFTGSGMLMALESAELLDSSISETGLDKRAYELKRSKLFRRRLLVSSLLRRAAFLPKAAGAAISLASLSDRLRSSLARGTRTGTGSTELRTER